MHHVAETGYVSEFHWGLVHKPISIREALQQIPRKKSGRRWRMGQEWGNPKNWPARDVKKAKPEAEIRQAKMKKYPLILRPLWIFATRSMRNLRNISRCTKALWCPEVKDDKGYRAVFVEQSASVSQVASGKISGQKLLTSRNDRRSTRQIFSIHPTKHVGSYKKIIPTRERLSPSRRPKNWDTIQEPAVLLNEASLVIIWQDCLGMKDWKKHY